MRPLRVASWVLFGLIVTAALVAGSGDSRPPTDADRVQRIASEIRCPTCRSQSVADSDAPAARFIREEISRRVQEGQTDEQIRSYLVGRYTDEILLDPSREGVGAVVWVLPLLAVTVALAALALAFRRWRPRGRRVSEADRALVEEALRR